MDITKYFKISATQICENFQSAVEKFGSNKPSITVPVSFIKDTFSKCENSKFGESYHFCGFKTKRSIFFSPKKELPTDGNITMRGYLSASGNLQLVEDAPTANTFTDFGEFLLAAEETPAEQRTTEEDEKL